jgi:hypothetical protein
MPEMTEDAVKILEPARAAELSVLVDLEAHWENLRKTPLGASEPASGLRQLKERQKAYEAFRGKLAAYNKRYAPGHVAELLLNNPVRLGRWCRAMRDLYLQVEPDPQGHCPVHLLEKAYRWADRVSALMQTDRITRSPAPDSIRAAIAELEALSLWCDGLVGAATKT